MMDDTIRNKNVRSFAKTIFLDFAHRLMKVQQFIIYNITDGPSRPGENFAVGNDSKTLQVENNNMLVNDQRFELFGGKVEYAN